MLRIFFSRRTLPPSSASSSSSSIGVVLPQLHSSLRRVSDVRNFGMDMEKTPDKNYRHEMTGPGFIDNTAPSLDLLDTTDMFTDKRAYGIPFKIDDEKAQELACQHHGTSVEIRSVERLLVPFWIAHTSAGGTMKAEFLRQNPTYQAENLMWDDASPFQFSYPFEEHHIFNQVAATYSLIPPTVAYDTCAGQHVPSMLISRWELLEECEEMKNAPKLLPFHVSVRSAVNVLNTRVNRELLDRTARKDLKKFYPNGFRRVHIRFIGVIFEMIKVRPVFLPVYKLQCATITHEDFELPTYVCGATGKSTGPVIHAPLRKKIFIGAAGALAGFGLTAPFVGPFVGGFFSGCATLGGVYGRHFQAVANAKTKVQQAEGATAQMRMEHAETDEMGYKWKVEDEEKYEYEFREELREKARRRMRFEQRVQEEAAQDDAQAQWARSEKEHRTRKPRRARRPGAKDMDPLGYYEILGLRGQEKKATKVDISKAFRKEAQIHHPDVVAQAQKENAKAKMQKLVEAYNVLRNKTLRREYDEGVLTNTSQ